MWAWPPVTAGRKWAWQAFARGTRPCCTAHGTLLWNFQFLSRGHRRGCLSPPPSAEGLSAPERPATGVELLATANLPSLSVSAWKMEENRDIESPDMSWLRKTGSFSPPAVRESRRDFRLDLKVSLTNYPPFTFSLSLRPIGPWRGRASGGH